MFDMDTVLIDIVGVDQNVIEICCTKLIKEWAQSVTDKILEICRVLLRPKSMTKDSNSPYHVRKAVFHSSPSAILTKL